MTRAGGRRAQRGARSSGSPQARPPDVPLLPPGAPLPWPHRAALASGFALIATLATRRLGSLDIGFHLRAGASLLALDGWPRHDTFTYTVNDHPYIDTSWGYQAIVALLHRLGGAPGLVLFHALLVVALFALLYRTVRLAPVDPGSLVLFLAAAGVASEMRFDVRPEIVSWLLLALVLHLLHRRAEGLRAPLALLPIIHLAWANLHSLFILGWAAIGAFAAGLWIRDRRADRPLLAAGAASVAAAFLNPYGWRGVAFPFTLVTRLRSGNAFADSIGEFASPLALRLSFIRPFYPRVPIDTFRVLAVLCLCALPIVLKQRRFPLVAVVAPFAVLSSLMIRNIPLLMIAGLPLLVWGLPLEGLAARAAWPARSWGPRLRALVRRAVPGACAAAALVLGLRVVHGAYYADARRVERFGTGWNRLALPVEAVAFADRAGIGGPVLNHLNFGGYLLGARPDRVFIDGRLEVMGETFYDEYRRALASPEALETEVAQRGIRWIVFPYSLDPPLLTRLSADTRWRLVHADALAAIFVRDDPGATAPVDPALVDQLRAPVAPVEIARLPGLGAVPRPGTLARFVAGVLGRREFPTDAYGLGLFHAYRAEWPQGIASFAAAIQASDGAFYEAYNNLGALLLRSGRRDEARACYRIVLEDDPGNQVARGVVQGGP